MKILNLSCLFSWVAKTNLSSMREVQIFKEPFFTQKIETSLIACGWSTPYLKSALKTPLKKPHGINFRGKKLDYHAPSILLEWASPQAF